MLEQLLPSKMLQDLAQKCFLQEIWRRWISKSHQTIVLADHCLRRPLQSRCCMHGPTASHGTQHAGPVPYPSRRPNRKSLRGQLRLLQILWLASCLRVDEPIDPASSVAPSPPDHAASDSCSRCLHSFCPQSDILRHCLRDSLAAVSKYCLGSSLKLCSCLLLSSAQRMQNCTFMEGKVEKDPPEPADTFPCTAHGFLPVICSIFRSSLSLLLSTVSQATMLCLWACICV